jgi:hypothetical protein
MRLRFRSSQTLWLAIVLLFQPAHAVLFLSTDDPEHNTQPPEGELAGSGWQWQGSWGSFLGTVIGPDAFVTARHVGGSIGDTFVFRGESYKTVAVYDEVSSDLRVWRVCGRFPDYAPLYEGTAEKGALIVVIGRGTQRGAPVYSPTRPQELRGWRPGAGDGRWRWGTNIVTEILKVDDSPGAADFLAMDFDQNGGGDEAHLSGGDSGGAVFIRDGGQWKLAGINHAVDGSFNTTTNGAGFGAALFNARGFYTGREGNWSLIPAFGRPIASAFYAGRISTQRAFLHGIIDQAGPELTPPEVLGAEAPEGPFIQETPVAIHADTQEIVLPLGTDSHFYRLRSDCPRSIRSVTFSGTEVHLKYD